MPAIPAEAAQMEGPEEGVGKAEAATGIRPLQGIAQRTKVGAEEAQVLGPGKVLIFLAVEAEERAGKS
jgi:hypothetical protein